jgi:hypothetical protein
MDHAILSTMMMALLPKQMIAILTALQHYTLNTKKREKYFFNLGQFPMIY